MAEKYHNFFRSLDETDIKIIKAIEVVGPRNVLGIARLIGITPGSIYPRIRRFKRTGVWVYASIRSLMLGLLPILVLVDEVPSKSRLVEEALTVIPYVKYLARCYGRVNGWCAIYTVPIQHVAGLRDFLLRVEEKGLIKSLELYEITGFDPFLPDFSYYDTKRKVWNFNWEEWFTLLKQDAFGRFKFSESVMYLGKALDKLDIELCAQLEKNSFRRIVELAKVLKKPVSTVKYRYDRLVRRGVIKKHVILTLPFPPDKSDIILTKFVCSRHDLLERLAAGLTRTPYIASIAKVIGQNAMFVYLYMPKPDLLNFVRVISRLAEQGYIRDYSFVILLTETAKSWGIPSHLFREEGGWNWNYEDYVKKLEGIIRGA